jgi:hypothetical protein
VLELKYSDQRIALASKYLGKYKLVEQHMRAAVTPRIDFGDEAVVAWSQLQNPGLKQMIGVQAQGAQNAGIADAMNVMGIVQNASQQAALEIVDRKRIEETYKNARGCG